MRDLRRGLLAAAWIFFLPCILPAAEAAAMKNLAVGQAAPAFSLGDVEGKAFESSSLAGAPAVVIFWSTWSPRSADMLADAGKIFQELSPKGLKVVAVNVDGENLSADRRREITDYAARMALPFPVLVDDRLAAFAAFGVVAHPSAAVLDAGGRTVYIINGYALSQREEFRDAILKVLGLYVEPEAPKAATAVYVPKGGALQFFNMGRQMMEMGQADKAMDYLNKSMERDPSFMEPFIAAARLSLTEGDLPRGEEMLKKLDPEAINRNDVRFLLGYLMLLKEKPAGAEAIFKSIADKAPAEGLGQWGLGLVALARGDGAAAALMEEAAKARPELFEAKAYLRRHFSGIWMKGESAPEEARFIALVPTLGETKERYRKLFSPGPAAP